VPAAALVLLGTVGGQPALQAAGVLVGAATGVLLYWWGGRLAARRLADRGADLLDLLRLGPQEPARPSATRPGREPVPQLSRARSAARGTLLTVGILCIFPQGLVPIGFNLLGVDEQVKVWFAARYLPQPVQVPAAAAFIVVGASGGPRPSGAAAEVHPAAGPGSPTRRLRCPCPGPPGVQDAGDDPDQVVRWRNSTPCGVEAVSWPGGRPARCRPG